MIKFDEKSEEIKAINWLNEKRNDCSQNSIDLHYLNILYYLIKYLMGDNE